MKPILRSCASVAGVALLLLPLAGRAWDPNAKDLEAAISRGEFVTHQARVTQWLNQKAPAAVTKDALEPLLKDAVFMNTLDQVQLMTLSGADRLGTFAKTNEGNRAFLSWLMNDTAVMDLYLEAGGVPSGDAAITTLSFWSRIFNADPDSKTGICLKIAIATALTRTAPFQDERGTARVTEPYEGRYLYYKKAHKEGELLPSFDRLSVWEVRKVVDALGAPPEDLTWVREMIRTWRPDLKRGNRLVKIVSEVKYGTSPIPIVDMASVLDAGGMCERRAHFGMKTCSAFGIPSIKILQAKHAALACIQDGEWKVEYGAGWGRSWLEGGVDGSQFLSEAVARSHRAEFSQSEHLKWFASALTATNTGKAITEIADKLVPRSADPKAMAKDPETQAEMEANAASKQTSAVGSATASQEVARVEGDTLHIPAAGFDKMENVMVYDSLPDGTGKQVNFQKNINDSWIDYTVDAPKAGAYSLVLKLAAPNRDQVLKVAVGTNTAATIPVPNTKGLWGLTPPLDLQLEKGKQTVRLSAPFQRGIAVKYLELKAK